MPRKILLVGISGVTNSGKTTVAARLRKAYPTSTSICQDAYFLPAKKLQWVEEVRHHNWDVLSALDMESMVKDIEGWMETTQRGDSGSQPALMFVEGFTIYGYKPLCSLLKKKYFLTLNYEECKARRDSRVYDPPDVPGYFDVVVWPEYVRHFNEIRKQEDIVFHDGAEGKDKIFQEIYKDVSELLQQA